MKNLTVYLFIFFIFISGCKTGKPLAGTGSSPNRDQEQVAMTNFSEQSTWLLGYFSADRLRRQPHSEWYLKGFDDYHPDSTIVKKLTEQSTNNLSVKIVMGTWCPDSRREVPRFMHILNIWKFPSDKVTFIGVDNAKLSPVAEYPDLDIQRVPTFIFYYNNFEIGRIVENPVTSLEQDIMNILKKE